MSQPEKDTSAENLEAIAAALTLPVGDEGRIRGLAHIADYLFDGDGLRPYYGTKHGMEGLLKRDPALLQLVNDVVLVGSPEEWNWDILRRYPAFRQPFYSILAGNHARGKDFQDEDASPTGALLYDFEQYRMLANKSIERPIQSLDVFPAVLYATFTFVRHADFKSTSMSVEKWDNSQPDVPTWSGKQQLESLPNEWKEVPIDVLYSSNQTRAYETAKAIASAFDPPKEVIQRNRLTEKDHGPVSDRYKASGNDDASYYVRTGLSRHDSRYGINFEEQVRFHIPEGGESEYDAAHRAQAEIIRLLLKHGVPLSDEEGRNTWDDVATKNHWDEHNAHYGLSSKIPHIMIVSHNLFLTELYESLCCWNSPDHRQTRTSYNNAAWSRHLLRISFPWDKTDWDKDSTGSKWFGLNVEKKDIREPSGCAGFGASIPNARAPSYRAARRYSTNM